jgi:hypothetical protein
MAHKDCRWEVNEIDFASPRHSLGEKGGFAGQPEAYRYVLRQSRDAGLTPPTRYRRWY